MAVRNFEVNQFVGMGDAMGAVEFVKQMEKMYDDRSIEGLKEEGGEIEDVAATKRIVDRFDARNLAALDWEATDRGQKYMRLEKANPEMGTAAFEALLANTKC